MKFVSKGHLNMSESVGCSELIDSTVLFGITKIIYSLVRGTSKYTNSSSGKDL